MNATQTQLPGSIIDREFAAPGEDPDQAAVEHLVAGLYDIMEDGKIDVSELPKLVSLLMRAVRNMRASGIKKRQLVVSAAIEVYERESGKPAPDFVKAILPGLVDTLYHFGGKQTFGRIKQTKLWRFCCCCCARGPRA